MGRRRDGYYHDNPRIIILPRHGWYASFKKEKWGKLLYLRAHHRQERRQIAHTTTRVEQPLGTGQDLLERTGPRRPLPAMDAHEGVRGAGRGAHGVVVVAAGGEQGLGPGGQGGDVVFEQQGEGLRQGRPPRRVVQVRRQEALQRAVVQYVFPEREGPLLEPPQDVPDRGFELGCCSRAVVVLRVECHGAVGGGGHAAAEDGREDFVGVGPFFEIAVGWGVERGKC